ncbi:MAG: YfiR family protein [Archangiaceae bacterium]|nr:YfiR family protein [Archangiaceae bacterium]
MRARGLAVVLALFAAVAAADELPADVQVRVLSKVLTYLRNFWPASGPALVFVVHPAEGQRARFAAVLANELEAADVGAERRLEAKTVKYGGVAELTARVRAERPRIAYVDAGFDDATTEQVLSALADSGVLTVAGKPSQVALGAIIGFHLSEGQPKLLVNRSVAIRERVDINPKLLKLAEVVK